MNRKQIILIAATALISISLTAMFFNLSKSQQNNTAVSIPTDNQTKPSAADTEPNKAISPAAIQVDVNSIIAQYDAIKSERYQQMTEVYSKALKMDPPYTLDSTARARSYADQGYYDKAIEVAQEDINNSPHWKDFYYALAWVYAKAGRYENAMDTCRKTISLFPQFSNIYHISAWINIRNGKYDQAVEDCNQAIKLDPTSYKTYYAIGRIYSVMDRKTDAIEAYKKSIQLKTDAPQTHLFLGIAYAEQGKLDEAIKSYKEAALLDIFYSEAYFFTGIAYDELKDYGKALEAFKKAAYNFYTRTNVSRIHSLGLRPDLSNLNCVIGICYLRLGQPYDASVAFKDAIDADNTHPGAHYGMALASIMLGDKKTAMAEYEAVKNLKDEKTAQPILDIINKVK